MHIWIFLSIIALILLAIYWNSRNAVWGGLMLGIIVGVLWKIFGEIDWYAVIKVATISTLLGFSTELLGMLFDYFKNHDNKVLK